MKSLTRVSVDTRERHRSRGLTSRGIDTVENKVGLPSACRHGVAFGWVGVSKATWHQYNPWDMRSSATENNCSGKFVFLSDNNIFIFLNIFSGQICSDSE